MDELDKLKSAWKKDENIYPKYSEKDIYAMLHKKSSSIVKWILIISIIEFIFWIGLSLVLKDNPTAKDVSRMNLDYVTTPMTVISYGIILYFVYAFYNSYKKISATDNVKTLMRNILMTRKTVSVYIFVNIAFAVLSAVVLFLIMYNTDAGILQLRQKIEAEGGLVMFNLMMLIICIVLLAIFAAIMWIFYKLVYGFLVKRLYKNYEELKKIDL